MKHILILFAVMMVLVPTVYAEEKSWYEIDGIKFRYGDSVQQIWFRTNDNENYSEEIIIKPDFQLKARKFPN